MKLFVSIDVAARSSLERLCPKVCQVDLNPMDPFKICPTFPNVNWN